MGDATSPVRSRKRCRPEDIGQLGRFVLAPAVVPGDRRGHRGTVLAQQDDGLRHARDPQADDLARRGGSQERHL